MPAFLPLSDLERRELCPLAVLVVLMASRKKNTCTKKYVYGRFIGLWLSHPLFSYITMSKRYISAILFKTAELEVHSNQ